jgi:ferric-dicitrate binding protein FerR (iron transport regulator)
MAEPYVPIARYTTADTLLTDLEVATTEASTNTTLLSTAVRSSLTSKQTAENVLGSGFDLFFLVGA